MEQRIKALREQMEQQISQINSKENLGAFWQDFLGKKGRIAELMKGLGAVAKEDRPAMGKVINDFKVQVEEKYKALRSPDAGQERDDQRVCRHGFRCV